LDDGFQHLRVKRDLDIVLLDATNPFGNGKLLPAGILRESLESLKRADVVVITRANLVDESKISNIKLRVSKIKTNCKILVSENKTIELTKLKDFSAKAQNLQIKNIKLSTLHSPLSAYCAFCALGNPENFYEQLRRENFNLVHTKNFPDHHFYSQSEITKLEKEAVTKGAEILLTTAKDAVKLAHLKFNFSCYVVESGLIFDDESAFIALIQNLKSKI
jgi:tetraacyldisaccharide 4'-kinase